MGIKEALALLLLFVTCSTNASMVDLKDTVWEKHARRCNIDPLLLYSIALKETSYRIDGGKYVIPHQYALNNPVFGSFYPKNRFQAVQKVNEFVSASLLTDIGVAQVNWRWNGRYYVTKPEELLDIDKNLEVASKVLCDAIALSPNDLAQAIGNYHTPNPEQRNKSQAYGKSVLLIWKRLKYND